MTVQSSTIGELTPYEASMQAIISEFKIPTEYLDENYNIKVKDILSLVTKGLIGLDKANNTADVDKPTSLATLAALNQKAALNHQHGLEDLPEVQNALQNYRLLNTKVPLADVEGLVQVIASLMPKDWRPAVSDVTGLPEALTAKSDTSHSHDITGLTGYHEMMAGLYGQLAQKASLTAVSEMVEAGFQQFAASAVIDRPDLSSW